MLSYHSSPLLEPGAGDAGGMTVYVRGLAKALARHGVHTDVFTRATGDAPRVVELSPAVRVVSIDAGPRAGLPKEELNAYLEEFVDGVRAFSFSQRVSYEMVHSHYWQSGLAGLSVSRAWGIPLVHSQHTLARVKNRFLAPGDVPEPEARLRGEDEVIAAADVLITSTDDEFAQLACLYGASHDRLTTIHPGVDHELFHPGERTAARRALGLEERPLLLCVGRVQPLKGLDLSIRTMAQLRDSYDRPPLLLIVGGTSGSRGRAHLEDLHRLVVAEGLQDDVRFMGPQPHTSLPELYRAADVVLMCSYSESFGLAALEAHACGTPVIGTAVGGLCHIVVDGATGSLVDSRDPAVFAPRLRVLLDDASVRDAFSRAAVRAAASFDWDSAAAATLELYDCLIEQRSPQLCTC